MVAECLYFICFLLNEYLHQRKKDAKMALDLLESR
jgi:hypothetical protein